MRNDAIIDPIPVPAIFGDRLLGLLIQFFDDLPHVVRWEVSLVMAALSEEKFIYPNEEFNYEYAVRDLFKCADPPSPSRQSDQRDRGL
jgi:hypothetical protein